MLIARRTIRCFNKNIATGQLLSCLPQYNYFHSLKIAGNFVLKKIMLGTITNIQRMSIHDGPGIRSTVFMKGCNLRCKWCHNPETFLPKPELEWISDKCINCGKCVKLCPSGAMNYYAGMVHFEKAKCKACFKCLDVCFPGALLKVGQIITPEELFAKVEQDFPFYEESGGGITFSGGEPMLQCDFTWDSLRLFKKANIHTAMETNLLSPWNKTESILPYTDLVMADLKVVDNERHKKWTGMGNRLILENIKKLDKTGKAYWLRTPLVPGVNNSEKEIEGIAKFVSKLNNLEKFELLPFHPLANTKYKNLGIDDPMKNVNAITTAELNNYQSILKNYKIY